MTTITLPTLEETQLNFNIDGTVLSIDPVSCNDLIMEAVNLERTCTGKETESGWRKFFVTLFERDYHITLNEFQAWALTEMCAKSLQDWKKKLFPLLGPSNSTDSLPVSP
jgi:hypothetical protein